MDISPQPFHHQRSPTDPAADIELLQLQLARLLQRQQLRRDSLARFEFSFDTLALNIDAIINVIQQHKQPEQHQQQQQQAPHHQNQNSIPQPLKLQQQQQPHHHQQLPRLQPHQIQGRIALGARNVNTTIVSGTQPQQEKNPPHKMPFGDAAPPQIPDLSFSSSSSSSSSSAADLKQQLFLLAQQTRDNRSASSNQQSFVAFASKLVDQLPVEQLREWEADFHLQQQFASHHHHNNSSSNNNNNNASHLSSCPFNLLADSVIQALYCSSRAHHAFRLMHEGCCNMMTMMSTMGDNNNNSKNNSRFCGCCLTREQIAAAHRALTSGLNAPVANAICSNGIKAETVEQLVAHLEALCC